jgi:tetratricopeptide (TPR) repeat protein
LSSDLQTFGDYLGRPEVLYALGRIERNSDDGSNLIADALARCGQAASLFNADAHLRVGETCERRAWDAEAKMEAGVILSVNAQPDDQSLILDQISAHMSLARIAEMHDQHRIVADQIDKALSANSDPNVNNSYLFLLSLSPDQLRTQVMCNRMQADREAGENAKADVALEKLRELAEADSDTAIAVVNDLRAHHRDDDAATYFDKAYGMQMLKLSSPMPIAEALNNVAWLCAKCVKLPKDAIELAERAVAIEPENYASLDTAATAYFADGNATEAVRLEKRALLFRPSDEFMQKQLARFEKGLKN